MTTLLEELERIGGALQTADPGDTAALGRLLSRRGELLNQLGEAVERDIPREVLPELLDRLTAISLAAAAPYRAVMLNRLLTRQHLSQLSQQRALLSALAEGTTKPSRGCLIRTAG